MCALRTPPSRTASSPPSTCMAAPRRTAAAPALPPALLRFNLAGIPAGAHDDGRDPEADQQDRIRARRRTPDHTRSPRRRLLVAEHGHRNTRTGHGVVQHALASRVAPDTAIPVSTSPVKLGLDRRVRARSARAGTHVRVPGTSRSASLAPALRPTEAGDGKPPSRSSRSVRTPFTVVCQDGTLTQSYLACATSAARARSRTLPGSCVDYGLPPPLETPSLISVVATGGTSAFVIGRVDGAANQTITLQASTAPTCVAGDARRRRQPPRAAGHGDDGRRRLFRRRRRGVTSGHLRRGAGDVAGDEPDVRVPGQLRATTIPGRRRSCSTARRRPRATSSTRRARRAGTSSPSRRASGSRSSCPGCRPTTTSRCSRTSARRSLSQFNPAPADDRRPD